MLRAQVITPDELSPEDIALWRAMLDGCPAMASPLLGPEFAQAVGLARKDAFVSVLKRDGRTAGFLAHHRTAGGYARPIGAPFSDYHALVCDPRAPVALPEALEASGLARLRFCAAVDPAGVFAASACGEAQAYPIDLRGVEAGAYLELLRQQNAKHYKRWRQLSCKIERDLGPIELLAGDPSRAALERAFAWKSAQLRRTGMYDVLKPAWVRTLMGDLFARQGQAFGGMHIVLRAGGRQIASSFGVRRGRAFHSWIATFDPCLSEYAPGRVLHFRGIGEMPAMGLDLWDLGPGHGEWKRRFVPNPVRVLQGLAEARPLPFRRASLDAAPAAVRGLTSRIANRMEHIAAAEPGAPGRVSGLLEALLDSRRRLVMSAAAD